MLYTKVLNFIKENKLITKKTVIVAVSGGADSVCLLDIMCHLAKTLDITVECAHLNHNLRGDESDGDESYVSSLCDKLGVTLHTKSVKVKDLSHGVGIEDAARRVRYEFFDELSRERDVVIATAHTVNDNTETFFINLLRGSGSRGLCGIPVKRDNIIRPLLCADREEIINHLREVGLEYRTDSTNADIVYLRNFIRHRIVPQFYEREGIDINKAVLRATHNLFCENEALSDIAKTITTESANDLSRLPDALLYRVLNMRFEEKFDKILDFCHFNAVRKLLTRDNSRVQITGDIYANVCYGRFYFDSISPKNADVIELSIGKNKFSDKTVLIKNIKEVYSTLTNYAIDCDKIKSAIIARTRRDGDIFYHPKRSVTTSLKKLLINDKVDKSKRDSLVIICDLADNIVFVEGYGADKRFMADKHSKNILGIEII